LAVACSCPHVRDATTGKPVGPVMMHPAAVQSAALSAADKLLRAHCSDGSIRLWDVAPLALPDDAEKVTLWVQVRTGLELDAAGVARGPPPGRRGGTSCGPSGCA